MQLISEVKVSYYILSMILNDRFVKLARINRSLFTDGIGGGVGNALGDEDLG